MQVKSMACSLALWLVAASSSAHETESASICQLPTMESTDSVVVHAEMISDLVHGAKLIDKDCSALAVIPAKDAKDASVQNFYRSFIGDRGDPAIRRYRVVVEGRYEPSHPSGPVFKITKVIDFQRVIP